jgi:putative membrane protein
MVAMLLRFVLSLFANAIGLIAAALIVPGFEINGLAFVTAVLIFSIATALLGPFISKVAFTSARFLMGGTALVTTFVGLLLAYLLTDGITVEGLTTWVFATLVVWIFAIIGNIILPLFLFKKWLGDKKEEPKPAPAQE